MDRILAAKSFETPELTPDQQFAADKQAEQAIGQSSPLPTLRPGTRVLALWVNAFYAATVCGNDYLNRYQVIFIEGSARRPAPPESVIPIGLLRAGTQVSFLEQRGKEELILEALVVRQPVENAEEWQKGEFLLQIVDRESKKPTNSTISVHWTKLYLSRAQGAQFVQQRNGHRKESKNGTDQDQQMEKSREKKPNGSGKLKMEKASGRSRKRKRAEEEEGQEKVPEKEEMPTGKVPKPIFAGLKFVLTIADGSVKKGTQFNKADCARAIQEHGGILLDDTYMGMARSKAGTGILLISDGHSRTHKFLWALTMAIPCVNFRWIGNCVQQERQLDYSPFLLPAGQSVLNGRLFPWTPLKADFLRNFRVLVYTNEPRDSPEWLLFDEIWEPLLRNVGAKIVPQTQLGIAGNGTGTPAKLIRRILGDAGKKDGGQGAETSQNAADFDVLFTHHDCEPEVVEMAKERGALVVNQNWLIEALVTGISTNSDLAAHEQFRYNFKA